MIPNIRTSPTSSSAIAPTQATQQPAQALQMAGATHDQGNPQGSLHGLTRRPTALATPEDPPRRGGRPLVALGILGVSATAAGLLARDGFRRLRPYPVNRAPGNVADTAYSELLGASAILFGGLVTAFTVARTHAAPARGRVDTVTLSDAVVAAEELSGLREGDFLNIANHLRDYGRGNEVSPAVTRAIEQAHAAPVGDIEAPPEALSGTALRIAENLRNLVTANPPILPRQS